MMAGVDVFELYPRRPSDRPLRLPRAYVERALAASDLASTKGLPQSATIEEVLDYFVQRKTPELICQRTFFILSHLHFISTVDLAMALKSYQRSHRGKGTLIVSFIIEVLQMWQRLISQKALAILTQVLWPYCKTAAANPLKLLVLRVQAESAKPLPKHVKRLGTVSPFGPPDDEAVSSSLLNDFPVEAILDRLAATEVDLFRRISPSELVNQGWQQDDRWNKSPNVCALIAHYNNVTTWVASEVLQTPRPGRVRRIKMFILMLEMSITKHWYNTAMEISGGLNHGAVSRQKRLWAEVPADAMAVFQKADELLTPQRNYNKLVSHINSLPRDTPVLPYLGVYLKELAMINAGNASFSDEKKTKINMQKGYLLGRCIADLMRLQEACAKIEASLPPNPVLDDRMAAAQFLTDESLWALSEKQQERLLQPALDDSRGRSSSPSGSGIRSGGGGGGSAITPTPSSEHTLTTSVSADVRAEATGDSPLQMSASDSHVGSVRTSSGGSRMARSRKSTASGASAERIIKVSFVYNDQRERLFMPPALVSPASLTAKALGIFQLSGPIEVLLRTRDASNAVQLTPLSEETLKWIAEQRSVKLVVRERDASSRSSHSSGNDALAITRSKSSPRAKSPSPSPSLTSLTGTPSSASSSPSSASTLLVSPKALHGVRSSSSLRSSQSGTRTPPPAAPSPTPGAP